MFFHQLSISLWRIGGGFLLSLLLASQALGQAACTGQEGPNLIVGGDFGSGTMMINPANPFLSPDLSHSSTAPLTEGTYTLTSSSSIAPVANCWQINADNSNDPQGYFLLAHTAGFEATIYERTVEVCDGISYTFRFDLINLLQSACATTDNPVIQLWINGELTYETELSTQNSSWQQHGVTIEVANGLDLLDIAIRYSTSDNPGNVIGLDNVALQHCAPTVTLPTESSFCEGEGVVLSIAANASTFDNPYYQWQKSFDGGNSWEDISGATDADLFVNNPIEGVYYRVQAANGPVNFLNESCRATSNATVLSAIAPVPYYQTPIICAGDTVTVGTDSFSEAGEYLSVLTSSAGCDSLVYTYLFTHPSYEQLYAVTLCPGDSFQGQTYFESGGFTEFMSTTEGCDSLIHYEIEVSGEEVLQIDGNTSLCEDSNTTLTAPAAYLTYQWNTGSDNSSISVETPGSYAVTVTNSMGCELTTSVEVVENDLFFIAESMDPSCPDSEDGEIEIMLVEGGAAPYSFQLNDGARTEAPLFTNLVAGDFLVNAQDANGCQYSQEVTLSEAAALAYELTGLPAGPIDMGDTVFLEATAIAENLTFLWSGDGLFSCRDCPVTSWVPLVEGNLQLSVESTLGCSQQLDTLIELRDRFRIYIPTAFSPNGDGNNDTFSPGLGSNVAQVLTWEIYDRWGGRLFAAVNQLPDDPSLAWDGSWRGQALDTGYYLYRAEIQFNNGRSKTFAGEVYLMR